MFKKSIFLLVILSCVYPIKSQAEYAYVGKEVCSECHKMQSKTFEKSLRTGKPRRMPNTLNFLKSEVIKKRVEIYRTPEKQKVDMNNVTLDLEKDYSKSSKCLQCHSTGYGKQGGYNPVKPNQDLAGITCEACHGSGKAYVPYMEKASETGKYKHMDGVKLGVTNLHDEKEKICLTCHKTNDTCPVISGIGKKYRFDYEKRAKRVHKMKKSGHVHEEVSKGKDGHEGHSHNDEQEADKHSNEGNHEGHQH